MGTIVTTVANNNNNNNEYVHSYSQYLFIDGSHSLQITLQENPPFFFIPYVLGFFRFRFGAQIFLAASKHTVS